MATIPSDPLFAQQWHLRNTTPGLFDLNVIDVWEDYTGAGVEVAIIDDGVQRTHPDLDGNYSRGKDWDFRDNDTDPSGVDGDNHGTAVAGIIGANANNGIGGVGVAYGSTIFGFRINFDNTLVQRLTTAINNASGITQTAGLNREADVVNMSLSTYSYFDVGRNAAEMTALNTAINNAASLGRNGLGTILVKSAGNKRGNFDPDIPNFNTNAMSWNANKHTISVAAVNQDGFVSNYSSPGASLLVSAFGTPGEVVTTDRVGGFGYNDTNNGNPDAPIDGDPLTDLNYTSIFSGTSAAAPMVSGVVALMLEANPNLGWRDVQEILAYSARHVGTNVGSGISGSEEYAWSFNGAKNWNGGGLHFSNDYGFGLVDAKAAVRLAETWGGNAQTSSNDGVFSTDFLNSSRTISQGDNGTGGTSFSQFVGGFIDIEHVEVDINFIEWHDLGDLEVRLISPNGTSSVLIDNSGENNGNSGGGFGSGRWEFFSNQFWGETTIGNWTVQLFDSDSSVVSPITIDDLDITFYGKKSNNDTFIFTEEYSDYAGKFGHTTSIRGNNITIDKINTAAIDSNTTVNLSTGRGTIDTVNVTVSGIKDIVTGDGNDSVVGNSLNNDLSGMRGNDTLKGEGGNDILRGGDGHDSLYGGDGRDFFMGGTGNDTMYGEDDNDEMYGFEGNDFLYGGAGIDRLYGKEDNDWLSGGDDNDFLDGGSTVTTINTGNDTLYGGIGADEMKGRDGNDYYYVDNVGDIVIESYNEGYDTVDSTISYTLGINVESLILTGANDVNGTGNSLDNYISGNSGKNFLSGNEGNDILSAAAGRDTLDGGIGADSLYGGTGDDFYYIDNIGDHVIEYSNNGNDMVISTIDYTLEANIENLLLIGFGDSNGYINGTGNSLDNRIDGNIAKNELRGDLGNDSLYGHNGLDELYGGDGLDELYGGADDDKLYGEDGNDYLVGESGKDQLKGGKGDDLLFGGDDKDKLDGGDGNDYLYGGDGDDKLKGKDGNDELFGDSGRDRIDGDNGDDFIMGGLGDDKLDGDHGNDELFGGEGNDTLDGDQDDDLLTGGKGNDFLEGDSGADKFIFYSWNEGTDTIKDFDWKEGDLIEIYQSGFGTGAQFSYDNNNGNLFFDGSDTVSGTYHIATLANTPSGFDINQHLDLV